MLKPKHRSKAETFVTKSLEHHCQFLPTEPQKRDELQDCLFQISFFNPYMLRRVDLVKKNLVLEVQLYIVLQSHRKGGALVYNLATQLLTLESNH